MKNHKTFVHVVLALLILTFAVDSFAEEKKRRRKKKRSSDSSMSADTDSDSGGGGYSRKYGMAGCGLGSLAFDKNSNQILPATTNGTFYSQLFGISSGTSNCKDSANDRTAKKMDQFIQINKIALAGDISRGQGESLDALRTLLGCSNAPQFNEALQSQFEVIYPNERVQFHQVTDSIMGIVTSDPSLSTGCSSVVSSRSS